MSSSKRRRPGRPDGQPPRGPRPLQPVVDQSIRELAAHLSERDGDLLRADSCLETDWEKVAALAVGHVMRTVPAVRRAASGADLEPSLPELEATEAVVAHSGVAGAIIDVSHALLLDHLTTMRVDMAVAGDGPLAPARPTYALELSGVVAGTRGTQRGRVVTLVDVDGMAAIIADLMLLAERESPDRLLELLEAVHARTTPTPTEGAPHAV